MDSVGEMFFKIFRVIMLFIDQLIFGFIPTVYNFIEILAKTYIFQQGEIEAFANNIYAIIGIFMVFRLAFILLNSIVDPDKLTSKEGGAGKMMMKLIVAIILIAGIPWGFKLAFQLQDTILENQILIKVILGKSNVNRDAGQTIGKEAMSAFITCNPLVTTCDKTKVDTWFSEAFPQDGSSSSWSSLFGNINEQTTVKDAAGVEKKEYNLSYSFLISTICGGFILYLMIMFSFEVAVRIVKLGFLQLISPIAVVGYVDPKGTIFNEWFKMVKNTYINLFIRLVSIYFMTYIISLLPGLTEIKGFSGEVLKDLNGQPLSFATIVFVKIFVIIGALMFAKQAPQMISNMFGLKEGSIGSLKSPLKSMVGGGIIGAAGGAAVGMGMKGASGLAGGISGGISSSRRGGSGWAGFKQGASAASSKVPLKGGFKKQFGDAAMSWNRGATAGASGATGTDTKVGMASYLEHRKNVTADQQKEAQSISQAKQAEALYNKLQGRKDAIGGDLTQNPYESIFGVNKYASSVWNVDKAKDQLKDKELARQTAYNAYALNPNAENQEAYGKSNKDYIDAQKYVDFYKGELDKLDKMEQFHTQAVNRSLVDAYSAQKKAEGAVNRTNTPPDNSFTDGGGI